MVEIGSALNRYKFLVSTLDKMLYRIELAGTDNNSWLAIAPKIGRKFWNQTLSLQLLFEHDWIIESGNDQVIITDLSSFYSLIRAMFEAYAVFHHLFNKEKDIEENIIRFRLWEIDGLSSRLKFQRDNPSDELLKKLEEDKIYIQAVKDMVEDLHYFKYLEEKHKKYLLQNLAWKFSSESLHRGTEQRRWQHTIKELIDRTHIKKHIISDMYNYYSMHVHTGYISILQNENLTPDEKVTGKWVSILNASFVTSFLIRDLSDFFKEGKFIYDSLTENEKNCLMSLWRNRTDSGKM